MSEAKTRKNNASVNEFIAAVDEEVLRNLMARSVEYMRGKYDCY
jgi:hypothetical protein